MMKDGVVGQNVLIESVVDDALNTGMMFSGGVLQVSILFAYVGLSPPASKRRLLLNLPLRLL